MKVLKYVFIQMNNYQQYFKNILKIKWKKMYRNKNKIKIEETFTKVFENNLKKKKSSVMNKLRNKEIYLMSIICIN